ncbi:MAG: heme-binding domain-containing protein [Pyrinomonadaceae bacterium]
MKRATKIIVVVLFSVLVVIQFSRPDVTNPPLVQSETLQSATAVPENVQAIFNRSCNDCHTNETVYPWYSKIQPAAWFLADHIKEGRSEMNFSLWNTYEARRKKRKLEEICEQIETKAMPLPSYLWIHRDAELSDVEIKTLCDWTKSEIAKFPTQ